MESPLDRVAAVMAAGAVDPASQLAQTAYRMSLVSGWGIREGATVLEVGCGQGDMTAALAHAVGPDGRVVAVDVAGPEYGAPVSLGESVAALRASGFGDRLDIRLGFDVVDQADTFQDDVFDHVVLAHCAWYFDSPDRLGRTLRAVRSLSPSLCFAEWDLRAVDEAQRAHLLAVVLQARFNAEDGNVRTPFSAATLTRLLDSTGWRVDRFDVVSTDGLQDADWEIAACLALPDSRERELLRSLARPSGNRPLPAYQLLASRC